MNRILFGFKGSGKTTFGKKLAEQLKKPFIDLDELIEKRYHLGIRELYKKVGEIEFRRIERETLLEIKSVTGSVIALGGGTVLDGENVKLLQTMGEMIYLKASFETIQKRIQDQPAFVLQTLKQIYEERLPIYESIPAVCIEND
jgi:shikimate kinase